MAARILFDNRGIVYSRIVEAVERVTLQTAEDIQVTAQGQAQVKTGYMRDTTDIAPTLKGLMIRFLAHYSPYVELGTTKQTAQPFLLPALEQYRPIYMQRLRDALKSLR